MNLERTINKYSEEADQIQIMKTKSNDTKTEIKSSGDIKTQTGRNQIYEVKVVKGNGIGTARTTRKDGIEETVKKAVKHSKINKGEKNLVKELEDKKTRTEQIGDKLEAKTLEEYIKKVKKAREYENKDTDIEYAGISYHELQETYIDTQGNHEEFKKKSASSWINYLTEKRDRGSYFISAQSYTDPYSNFTENCKEALEKSEHLSKKKKEKGKKNLLFRKRSIGSFLERAIGYYLDAYHVHQGKSEVEIDQEIGNTNLNIINSGTLPDGAHTRGFDEEGTTKKETDLVKDGKVNSYLHDDYTGEIFNTESTGSSNDLLFKGGISLDNLVVEPGEKIDTSKAIVIDSMTGNIDYSTGDYSFEATSTWEKNGEALHNFVFQGNLFKDLKKLKVGKEKKRQRPGIRSPDLMLKNKEIKPK